MKRASQPTELFGRQRSVQQVEWKRERDRGNEITFEISELQTSSLIQEDEFRHQC